MADTLFDGQSSDAGRPLAVRMRPRTLEQFVGQTHLLAEGSALRTAIEQGRPHSMVLYGPPGLGQDDARADDRRALAGRLRGAERRAGRPRRGARGDRARRAPPLVAPGDAASGRTVLFLDEIHRFNKAQQDALLPAVEEGLLTLIGATTENPAFEVNGALAVARARVCAAGAQRRGGRRIASPPPHRRTSTRTRSSSSRRAAKATRARHSTHSSWRSRRQPRPRAERRARRRGCPRHAGAGRGRSAAPRRALRQRRRSPLRLRLGLDQGDARLGPRRLAVLPRRDARGRRGPALHRAADGDPRLRGHRQCRPAGAVARDGRSSRRRARRAARGHATRLRRPRSTWRSRRSRTPRAGRSAQRARMCGSTGRSPRPRGCAPDPGRGRTSRTTTTLTTTLATYPRRSCCRSASRARASTSPTRRRPSSPAGLRRIRAARGIEQP